MKNSIKERANKVSIKVGKSNSINANVSVNLKFANSNAETDLIGNINNESGLVDKKMLLELQTLMIKYRVNKIDIGWKGKF